MTKRWSAFDGENKSNKKQKHDDIDALWDDGLDDKDLEECFELATQVVNDQKEGNGIITQSNNFSLLANYSTFKIPGNPCLISSTPFEPNSKPSTSSSTVFELETELQKLKQQHVEKDGEIAILRSKLQESKAKVEQQKTNSNWWDKLQASQKEMKMVKSDLEFKNLEIANLKQKLVDVRTQNNLDFTLIATQMQKKSPVKQKVEVKVGRTKTLQEENGSLSYKKQAVCESICPLKSMVSSELFKALPEERHIMNNSHSKISRNTLPYLQNQTSDCDTKVRHKCFTVENTVLNIDYVYPEMLKIINSSKELLDCDESVHLINKILCVGLELLFDFYDYLKQMENNLRMEDVQQADSDYLKHSFTDTCDLNLDICSKNEIGIKSGLILRFLSNILPFNKHLDQYICHNKLSTFYGCDNEYLQHFPRIKNGNINFLSCILDIVRLIGIFRKAGQTTYFLSSVVNLLTNICKSESYEIVSEQVCNLAKEVIFARPTVNVVYHMTRLLKVASHHTLFVDFLFGNSRKPSIQPYVPKGIAHFSEDACPFAVFAALYKNTILKLEHIPVVVCVNMLTFIQNTVLNCFEAHNSSSKQCVHCFPQLYRLEVETVFKGLKRYVEDIESCKNSTEDWKKFLEHKIVVKVLRTMATINYEITDYVAMYCQFKDIESKLSVLNGECESEKLSINDDNLVTISVDTFANIDF